MAVRATPMVCPEERPLVRPQVQTLYPIGMPTPRRGCRGDRREARAQWAQPLNAVSAPEFRQTTSGAHGSANRADGLPRGKPPVRPQAQIHASSVRRLPEGVQGASGKPPACMTRDNSAARNFLLIGPDAPTPAREKGLQPYGALTLFFRWRKKSVQKKASGTATPGKSPLLPILAAGLAMSRAAQLDCQH